MKSLDAVGMSLTASKFSQRKALPKKPMSYSISKSTKLPELNQKDVASNVSPTRRLPFPMAKSWTHSTHFLDTANGTKLLAKVYRIETPSQYLQLETLLNSLQTATPSSSLIHQNHKVQLPIDHYPVGEEGVCVIRPRGEATLQEQMEVLGAKRMISREDTWRIIADTADAVKELNERQLVHLGIKPENLVFFEAIKIYKLVDVVFNEYVTASIKDDEAKKLKERLSVYPHLDGKSEHTIVIFNKQGNDYINTRHPGHRGASSKTSRLPAKYSDKPIVSPYTPPELLETAVTPFGYNDTSARADSFSIGVYSF